MLGASADLVYRAKSLGAKETAFVPVPAPELPKAASSRSDTRAALGVEDFATHHVTLDDAPAAYEAFQKKQDGAFKVLITP